MNFLFFFIGSLKVFLLKVIFLIKFLMQLLQIVIQIIILKVSSFFYQDNQRKNISYEQHNKYQTNYQMTTTQDCFGLYVKDQYGLGQIVMVSSCTTIMDLADTLRQTLEKQGQFFLLKFEEKFLFNLFNTMQQEHIYQNSIIQIVGLTEELSSKFFEYTISFCFKKQLHQVLVNLNYSGAYLKEKISRILKLHSQQIQVLFNDDVIQNVENIFEHGILPYTQIYVQEKCQKPVGNLLEEKSISYSYYIHRQTNISGNQLEIKNVQSGYIDDSSAQCQNLSPTPFSLKKLTQTTIDQISPIKKKKTVLNLIENDSFRQNTIVLQHIALQQMIQSCQSQPGDSLTNRSDILYEDLFDDKSKIIKNPQNFHQIKFTDSYYDPNEITKEKIDPIWLSNEKGQQFKIQGKKSSTVQDIKSILAIYENTQKQNLSVTSPQIEFSLDDNIQLVNLNKKILNNLRILRRN